MPQRAGISAYIVTKPHRSELSDHPSVQARLREPMDCTSFAAPSTRSTQLAHFRYTIHNCCPHDVDVPAVGPRLPCGPWARRQLMTSCVASESTPRSRPARTSHHATISPANTAPRTTHYLRRHRVSHRSQHLTSRQLGPGSIRSTLICSAGTISGVICQRQRNCAVSHPARRRASRGHRRSPDRRQPFHQ